jgi:hypothetical protein
VLVLVLVLGTSEDLRIWGPEYEYEYEYEHEIGSDRLGSSGSKT